MDRLIIFLIICAGVSALLTWVLNYFFGVRKYVKYIPGGLALLLAIYNFIVARQHTGEGFQDLALILLAMLLLAGAVGGLLTAVLLEQQRKNKG